jgi:hypothetical protein
MRDVILRDDGYRAASVLDSLTLALVSLRRRPLYEAIAMIKTLDPTHKHREIVHTYWLEIARRMQFAEATPDTARVLVKLATRDFDIDESGRLLAYRGASRDVIVPYGVTSITTTAFPIYARDIVSIVFPVTLETIERFAFVNTTWTEQPDLQGLTSLETIGDYAFASATEQPILKGLVSLKTIGDNAFMNATGQPDLQGLTSLETIGNSAFRSATGQPDLQGLTSLETIGDWAFRDATGQPNLQGLTSLETIGDAAFMNATGQPDLRGLVSLKTIGDWAFGDATGQPILRGLTSLRRSRLH